MEILPRLPTPTLRRDDSPAAAILAGGLSTRLGQDKASASFGRATVLEWQRDRLLPLFRHVFVVCKDPARLSRLGTPVVADALRASASGVGVYTAVLASPCDHVLCLACDMPFVPDALLRALIEGCGAYDVFVPRHSGGLEPLCAVYSKAVLAPLETQLARGANRIDLLYQEVSTGFLDLDTRNFGDPREMFLNINTPQEMDRARRRLAVGRVMPDRVSRSRDGAGGRVEAFIRRLPLPVISFVGKKKSGKTTVAKEVVRELVRRGNRVAVFKHHSHELEADTPHTDSYRFREAGAIVAGLYGAQEYFHVARASHPPTLEDHVRKIPEPVDLIITEGFKRQDAPKIEVSRRARSTELVCDPTELMAIVSDQTFQGYQGVPLFSLDAPLAVADFVDRWVREEWPRLHVGEVGWREPDSSPTHAEEGAS
ncbi:MAG: molybdopterin-guanine dinucleotide biosynthesis protein B [Actinobacteria bacterium]|nr:molybdopterin-guanine dinucleotide biosynthesis protein B [Actinomycetota bacterium]